MNLQHITHIFWDWNGTLLNDLKACLGAMNNMLLKRGREQITEQDYKAIFAFPVKNYYKKLKFDFKKEPFEDLSVEFMTEYHKLKPVMRLSHYSVDALKHFLLQGRQQVILSAMEQKTLERQVMDFGVYHFFHNILGTSDIYASGKQYIAEKFIKTAGLDTRKAIFIGDTLHDFEVATALGIQPILIANGHQNTNRLNTTGAPIYANLNEFLSIVQ